MQIQWTPEEYSERLHLPVEFIRSTLRTQNQIKVVYQAKNLSEARENFKNSPYGGGIRREAMRVWLSFCQTEDQVREALNIAQNPEDTKLATMKLIDMANENIIRPVNTCSAIMETSYSRV
jgi:hypothetical protein